MSGVLSLASATALTVAVWCLYKIAKAIVERLSDRIADWTMPSSQAATFRLAWIIARAAKLIAPSTTLSVNSAFSEFLVYELARVIRERTPTDWLKPDEALAELEAELAADNRVIDPVRLTIPLLPLAIRARASSVWIFALSIGLGFVLAIRNIPIYFALFRVLAPMLIGTLVTSVRRRVSRSKTSATKAPRNGD